MLKKLLRNTSGSVLLYTGLSIVVFVGFSGLGFDLSKWYLDRRVMQSAVDAAALHAALALATGGDQTALESAVDDSLANNAFVIKAHDNLSVVSPPTTGDEAGNTSAVEVVIDRQADLYFSSVITDDIHIVTRAIAGIVVIGEHCLLALDEEIDSALEFTGTADADINCGVASNSSSNRALHVGGSASLTADPAQAFGDIYVEGSASLITQTPPQPHAPRIDDPFGPEGRNLVVPDLTGMTCTPSPDLGGPPGPWPPLNPGYYCGDFLLENKTVTLNPGVYIIKDGDFSTKAHSVIFGNGVTIILTGTTPSDVGTIEITSGSTVNLTAPTTGTYAGILFYIDQQAESYDVVGDPIQELVLGGASMELNGAIYAASREVVYTGGSTTTGECIQIVARKITITGNTIIDNDPAACAAIGLDPIDQTRVRLLT